MPPADVAALIEAQIRSGWDPQDPDQNSYGVDLERCLVRPPELRTYLDSFDADRPIDLWLVLRENPEGGSGYEVIFSEEEGEFGLAVPGEHGTSVLIGIYGSFPETLASM